MELFSEVNLALIAPLIIIQFVLMIIAVIDFIKARDDEGLHIAWLFAILFLSLVGPIAYFIFGRRK